MDMFKSFQLDPLVTFVLTAVFHLRQGIEQTNRFMNWLQPKVLHWIQVKTDFFETCAEDKIPGCHQ